ncbi:hypothetical protein [Mycolicibacterium tokaiense]|uniref:Uncharacterized protein n=1 Tax=Mycolicibacterium tokaiense TaxID=39695 RepID=A0A378TA55_9MYCO|nr:hypothetical protein [Mycolicibacterium tokaiense]BBY88458.1 hypothetical protein MTOK_42400 [Mycolicibacterium tokaiense]STZ57017.1 Uncharacterised protein [Mycolicibacterium tokaiense]
MPPGALVYQALVRDALAAEYERRKGLENRGAVLLTSSGTMVTIIFGLTVFITGKDFVFVNRSAVELVCQSLIPFVLSAVLAIFVQAFLPKYEVIKSEDLVKLVRDDKYWTSSAEDATRESVDLQVKTTCSLRKGNGFKAFCVLTSFGLQLVAIAMVSGAVAMELMCRLQVQ